MTKATTAPARLAIMRGWLGEKEVPGPKANPVIAGTPTSWFSLVGYSEIKSDEVANCAAAAGASLVIETIERALEGTGYSFADVVRDIESKDAEISARARDVINFAKATTPLPPRDTRLLARSYASFGVDARSDPQPGDFIIVPRGVSWQGHIMQIDEVQSSLGRFKCIGANQSDMTSVAYVAFDAEIVAIRRPVAPTAKDLLAAGSNGVARGVALKRTGDLLTYGTPVGAATAKVVEKVAAAPDATPAALPDVSTLDGMKTATEHIGIVQAFSDALIGCGKLFVAYPWLLAPIAAGVIIRVYGVQTIAARIRSFVAGVPLSNQT